jgi:hypothetical protein
LRFTCGTSLHFSPINILPFSPMVRMIAQQTIDTDGSDLTILSIVQLKYEYLTNACCLKFGLVHRW